MLFLGSGFLSPSGTWAQGGASCSTGNDDELLTNITYTGIHFVQACHTIVTGPAVVIQDGSDTAFRAGREIVLGEGFSVELGARFRALVTATLPPVMSLTQPLPDSIVYNDTTPAVAVEYSDGSPGVDLDTLLVVVDGQDITPSCAKSAESAVCESIALAPGTHQVMASIQDLDSNEAVVSRSFELVIDVEMPTLTILEPAALVDDNANPKMLLAYDGGASEIDIDSLVFKVDSNDRTSSCSKGLSWSDCTYGPLALGTHTVEATLRDLAGNMAGASQAFEIRDTMAPDVSFSAPTDNRIDWDLSPLVEVDWIDNFANSNLDLSTFILEVDGVVVPAEACSPPHRFLGATCEAEWGYGVHTAVARIGDLAGNEGTVTRVFEVVHETVPPDILITDPVAEVSATDGVVTIRVDYADRGELSAGGLGIDIGSLEIEVDGQDVVPNCTQITATGADCASGVLAQGSHTITARISDWGETQSVASRTFELIVDPEPPVLTVVEPPAVVENDSSPPLVVQYSDSASGIDLDTLVLKRNNLSLGCNKGSGSAECSSFGLIPYVYSIEASIADRAGNTVTATHTFEIQDTIAPTILVTAPTSSQIDSDLEPQITVYYTDGYAGINQGSFVLMVDGVDRTIDCTVGSSTASCNAAWGIGAHSVVATVKDASDNESSATREFEIIEDTVAPELAVVSLDDIVYDDPTPTFVVSYSDRGVVSAEGLGLELSTLLVQIDGQNVTSCSVYSQQANCEAPALAAGMHTITAEIEDKAQNTGNTSQTFELVLDTGAPRLEVTEPARIVYSDTSPQIRVDYSDASPGLDLGSLYVDVDGQVVTSSCDTTSSSAYATCESPTLVDGPHVITARIRDLLANETTTSYAFELTTDPDPPALAIVRPSLIVEDDRYPVVEVSYGDTTSGIDADSLVVSIDGANLINPGCSRGASSAVCTSHLLNPGSHSIEATVLDLAGNQATATHTFDLLDTQAPTVAIQKPESPRIESESSPEIRVVYSDAVGIVTNTFVLEVDGQDRTAECPTISPTQASCYAAWGIGTHNVTARVRDSSDNEGTANLTFEMVQDSVAPDLAITQPGSEVASSDGIVAVVLAYADHGELSDAGIGLDLDSLAISVDGQDIKPNCGTIAATWASCSTSALTPGTHTVLASIMDLAGNETVASRSFELTIDTVPPVLAVLEPPAIIDDQPTVYALVEYSDADSGVDLSSLVVLPNIGANNCPSRGAASTSCSIPYGGTPGEYEITASISDLAGNSTTVVHPFDVRDTLPPTLAFPIFPPTRIDRDLSPEIRVSFGDSFTGIDADTFILEVDGLERTSDCVFHTSSTRICDAEWGFGVHTVVAKISDNADNEGAVTSIFELVEELVVPSVVISEPSEQTIDDEYRPPIQVDYYDRGAVSAGGIGLDLATVVIRLDGEDITGWCEVGPSATTCDHPPEQQVGEHTITASVFDLNGNEGTATKTYDLVDDELRLLIVEPGDVASSPEVVVTYRDLSSGVDLESLAIEVDGADITPDCFVDPAYASCDIADLSVGAHSVHVEVRDGDMNLSEADKEFVVKSVPYRAIADCAPLAGPVPLDVLHRTRFEHPGGVNGFWWDFEGDEVDDTFDQVALDYVRTVGRSGTRVARLKIVNDLGEFTTDTCVIRAGQNLPTAEASATPSNGPAPLDVDFVCVGTDVEGPIASYVWDFEGDGIYDYFSSSDGSVSYTYPTAGTFEAVCQVTDTEGLTATAPTTETLIQVTDPGYPSVEAVATPTQGDAPLVVTFSGSATDDGAITLWEWDFEDDGQYDFSSASGPDTNHTYVNGGYFTARLRVIDDVGLAASDVVQIAVDTEASLAISDDTIDPSLGETAEVVTTLSAGVPARLVIKDRAGAVRRVLADEFRGAGSYTDIWDGTDDAGQPLPHGDYYAVLEYFYQGETRYVDLTLTTGGFRYAPTRPDVPATFSPFENDPQEFQFTIPPRSFFSTGLSTGGASEVTVFIGLYGADERLFTLLSREPLGVGTHHMAWDGIDLGGNLAAAPPGDGFLIGVLAYNLADNAIMLQSAPRISDVWVTPNVFDPATPDYIDPESPTVEISYTLDKPADVELSITNLATGVVLRTVVENQVPAGSGNMIRWDGHASDGRFADRGDYRLTLRAIDDLGGVSLARHVLMRVFY